MEWKQVSSIADSQRSGAAGKGTVDGENVLTATHAQVKVK
jgi:hypothetical protein